MGHGYRHIKRSILHPNGQERTSAEDGSVLVTGLDTRRLSALPLFGHLDQGALHVTDRIPEWCWKIRLNNISTEECHGVLVN